MKRFAAILAVLLILLTIPTMPHAGSVKIPKGAYGVWTVSSSKAVSPLYTSKANTSAMNQKVVDREKAALWWKYSKGNAIVDHLDSELDGGIWRVNEYHVGDIGVLTTSKGKTYYECRAIWMGTQTKFVYKYDGVTIAVKQGDIICVSCADEDGYDYIAYFKRIC